MKKVNHLENLIDWMFALIIVSVVCYTFYIIHEMQTIKSLKETCLLVAKNGDFVWRMDYCADLFK